MIVGERLRSMREMKQLSQGDVEKRSGLLRCYISRVENGHTVPALETLEKLARALDVPLYQLLYEGEEPPKARFATTGSSRAKVWGASGKEARYLRKLQQCLASMDETDRNLLLSTVARMSKKKKPKRTR